MWQFRQESSTETTFIHWKRRKKASVFSVVLFNSLCAFELESMTVAYLLLSCTLLTSCTNSPSRLHRLTDQQHFAPVYLCSMCLSLAAQPLWPCRASQVRPCLVLVLCVCTQTLFQSSDRNDSSLKQPSVKGASECSVLFSKPSMTELFPSCVSGRKVHFKCPLLCL